MRRRYLIIFTVIITAAILAAVWWWRRPERVVTAAVVKLADAKTQRFTADLTIANSGAAQQVLGQPATVVMRLNGAFARRESERDALTADVELVTETEGITLRVEGTTRFIGDKAYVHITTAPATFPLLAQLKDQWIELPRGGQSNDNSAASGDELFSTVDRGSRTKIAGDWVTVYNANATGQAVIRLLDGIADVLGTRLTAEQIDGIRQAVAADATVPVEVWATPWTHELRRLSASLPVPNQTTISFVLTLAERNQAQDIAVPANAQTLEGIVAGLQSSPSPAP